MEYWTNEKIKKASYYWLVYYDGKFGKAIFLVWELGRNVQFIIPAHYDVYQDEILEEEYKTINYEEAVKLHHKEKVSIYNYLMGCCRNTPKIRAGKEDD